MNTVWWWCGLGLVLLCLEMVTGTMYLLWLGLAALAMSLLNGFLPGMSLALQALNYAILCTITLALMRKYEKRKPTLRIGQAQGEEIGREGLVVVAITANQPGKIQFSQGLLGSKEWTAYADTAIAAQQAAKVVAVEGNALRVTAI